MNESKISFPCSLCGKSEFSFLTYAGFFSSKTTAKICTNCGLMCLNPRWNETGYEEYYRTGYYQQYHSMTAITPVIDERARGIASKVKEIVPTDCRILEVGCGPGNNLLGLSEAGFSDISCIEVDGACCEAVKRSIPGVSVFKGTLQEYRLVGTDAKPFDLIILSHVLEHFVEPQLALQSIGQLLAPYGTLLIVVPDAERQQNFLRQMTVPHTHYFTPRTLCALLQQNGFPDLTLLPWREDEIMVAAKVFGEAGPCRETGDISEYSLQLRRARGEFYREIPRLLLRRGMEGLLTENIAYSLIQKTRSIIGLATGKR